MDVLERDAVELAFVDVGNAIVFASLGTTAGRLEVVFEPVRRKPMEMHTNKSTVNTTFIMITISDRDNAYIRRSVHTTDRDKSQMLHITKYRSR